MSCYSKIPNTVYSLDLPSKKGVIGRVEQWWTYAFKPWIDLLLGTLVLQTNLKCTVGKYVEFRTKNLSKKV